MVIVGRITCLWGVGGRLSVQVVRAAVIFSPRGEAKRKPQQIHEALERLDGQMFVALSSSGAALGPGWTVWGNLVG